MAMACSTIVGASADAVFTASSGDTVTRITNPDGQPGDTDGIIGDRELGYGWSVAERDGYLYIGGWRNTVGAVIKLYLESALVASGKMDSDTVWKLVDIFTNSEVPRPTTTNAGVLIKIDPDNPDDCTVITEMSNPFRHVATYEGDLYFTTYIGGSGTEPKIYKLDKDDNLTEVYSTKQGSSMRANCIYRDYLYFAGTNASEPIKAGETCKMAVMRKADGDEKAWDQVADYTDFVYTSEYVNDEGETVTETGYYGDDSFVSSVSGAPVWDMTAFNDEIYLTIPNECGYVVFRGHPAKAGEKANKYGWVWTEVIGRDVNSPNNQGLCDGNKLGYVGDDGYLTGYRSVVGALGVYDGHLYTYDIDHTIAAELAAIQGMLGLMTGSDADPAPYLLPMKTTLDHPQRLWRMDTDTKEFEEMTSFTELTSGTTNEYIWKHGVYNGEFYISTMDSKVIYNYLTRLSGGSFNEMTGEEKLRQLQTIGEFLREAMAQQEADNGAFNEKIEEIINKLTAPDEETTAEETSEAEQALRDKIAELKEKYDDGSKTPEEVAEEISKLISEGGIPDELREELAADANELAELAKAAAGEKSQDFAAKMSEIFSSVAPNSEQAEAYRQKLQDTINEISQETQDEKMSLMLMTMAYLASREFLTDSEEDGELMGEVAGLIFDVQELDRNDPDAVRALAEKYEDLPAKLGTKFADIAQKIQADPQAASLTEEEQQQLADTFKSMAEKAQGVFTKNYSEEIAEMAKKAEQMRMYYNAVQLYSYISDYVKKDTQGFDIYKSSDGVNWELVTDDGFGDKFNYGALRFVTSDDGMYITTANPFYGAQLYKLSNDLEAPEVPEITVTPESAKWVLDSEEGLVFETDSASEWVTVRDAEGKHLGMDIENGVTIKDGKITLSPEYLTALGEGTYDIEFVLEEGSAAVSFEIAAEADEETTDGETTDSETTSEEDDYLKGDVNGDGEVNVTDVVLAAAHVKSVRPLNEDHFKRADVNADGDVNVTDLMKIAAHVKGIKPLE